MESLPIDTSHPAVRDYLALVRLQVLTPLSLLINIATVMVCSLIVSPNISEVARLYPTTISPQPQMIAAYIIAIYIGQIAYCILLVLARNTETKRALVQGVGLPLVFSNWLMAGWAVAWIFQAFLVSTILLAALLALLLYANIVLIIYHRPTTSRLFDLALIHAPMRAFLIWPFGVMFPCSLFITLGLSWSPGEPQHYGKYMWEGFGVVLGVNLLFLLVVVLRRDIVLCVAASWICASIWSLRPKPFPVFITVVLFTIAHPLALLASALWSHFKRKQRGAIALPSDEEETGGAAHGRERGAREVDVDALWG